MLELVAYVIPCLHVYINDYFEILIKNIMINYVRQQQHKVVCYTF